MASVDLVVTRYKEPLRWLRPYLHRPGWTTFIYNTGPSLPHVCDGAGVVRCAQVANAGYEWHGYLRHIIDRYDSLAELLIFMQGDPLTVSPDAHCLLNQTTLYAPVQTLSWVQQAKRKMALFSNCAASNLGGCRVWVEPVTSGLRPMLHGDRWLHRACRMAKRMKSGLYQFLYTQLASEHNLTVGPAAVHTGLMRSVRVPPHLYRAYGAQFAVQRWVLRERPSHFYARLLRWLVTHYDDMARAGFLNMWRAYTTKEKAILMELMWMSLLRAERFVKPGLCATCLGSAKALPVPFDAVGPSCSHDYFTGAPRVEDCNVTGDGWGGKQPCSAPYCGRLHYECPITKNDHEVSQPRGTS
ncbi:hypothetical protein AB1Y20_020350 [Prymnesium parvum]|uniref:Uncharacterized protein n=1 Tax=Prymnesium parvum TaxID=97485 RepID=A0AB34JTC6_PRYPA